MFDNLRVTLLLLNSKFSLLTLTFFHENHFTFRMVANMYFLTLSLVIILSEACIPPPPSPSPTTTKAPSSSTTKAPTTTAKPKDCPMDGKTCLADNLIEIKAADGPDACSKYNYASIHLSNLTC